MSPKQPRTERQQGEKQESVPQVPAERDESGHSQAADAPSMRPLGRQAQQDLEAGRSDTSRSEESDASYRKLRDGDTGA